MGRLLFAFLLLSSLLLWCGAPEVSGQRTTWFRLLNSTAPKWSVRSSAALHFVDRTTSFRDGSNGRAVILTSYFLLYSGDNAQGTTSNDVWASTNGQSWVWVAGVQINGEKHGSYPDTFPFRVGAAHCQDVGLRQYLVGGSSDNLLSNDVWMSVDGFRWNLQTPAAQFDPVQGASMAADTSVPPPGRIYLAGGVLSARGWPSSSAVWSSVNQGRTWLQMTSGVGEFLRPIGPGARTSAQLLGLPSGQLLWMTGVNSKSADVDYDAYRQDVWVSSSQGRAWAATNLGVSGFERRDDARVVVTAQGMLLMAGGYAREPTGSTTLDTLYNDVYVSLNGGFSWTQCAEEAEWAGRRWQMAALDGEGYLYVMGGSSENGGELDDVWKSTFPWSDPVDVAKRCQARLPSCGVGLRCLPASNRTLVASDGSTVYCDACPYACNRTAQGSEWDAAVSSSE